MEREILLPLEREYTDKEKIGLLIQQNQNLIDQLEKGKLVNQYLKNKISTLHTAIYNADKRVDEARLKLAKQIKEFERYKENMKNTVINQVKRQRRAK